jgi:hypothetical protein
VFWAVPLLALFAAPQRSHALHFDYLAEQNPNGQIVTGTNDFDNGNALVLPVRVFYRDLDYLPDGTSFGSDPGYSAVSPINVPDGYFALPPSTPLSFDMMAYSIGGAGVSNLWYWNGQGDVNFQPAVGQNFKLSVGNNSISVNGAAAGVTGLTIQLTTSTGSMHFHPSYYLTSTSGGVPAEGVYMIAQELRMPGLINSLPYYTLFVTNAISDAAYVDAQNWAKSDMVVPGDVNNDGAVNGLDLSMVLGKWLTKAPAGDNKYLPAGDANYDGAVNGLDLSLVLGHWLQTAATMNGNVVTTTSVPEPATFAQAMSAAALVALGARRAARARRRALFSPVLV